MWANLQKTSGLFTFTKEIVNGKLPFLFRLNLNTFGLINIDFNQPITWWDLNIDQINPFRTNFPIYSNSFQYSPWKHQKTKDFLVFSGGVEWDTGNIYWKYWDTECWKALEKTGTLARNGLNWFFKTFYVTAQKMKLFVKDFFSKCDQIRMVNFIFCAVSCLMKPYARSFQNGSKMMHKS